MEEKTVYFVQHGQSEGNTAKAFQPPDSPLTELGKEQAQKIAERVSHLSFETLIVSPLTRTKETADAIANATGKQPEYSDLFIERVKPTNLNGKPYGDPEAEALYSKWEESLYTSGKRAEDGENYDDLIKRADAALRFLKNRKEASMVVVTHGFFLRTILARVILGDTPHGDAFRNIQSYMRMENTGLTVLRYSTEYEGASWRLWIYNDHAHLG